MGLFGSLVEGVLAIVDDFIEQDQTSPVQESGSSVPIQTDPIESEHVAPDDRIEGQYDSNAITAFKPVRRKYTTSSGDNFMPLWQKAGWLVNVHDPSLYIGTYRFFDKRRQKTFRWEGAIQYGPHEIKVYIKDPPVKLQSHEHWQCFNHKGDGWYLVHFLYDLKGLDDAILNVQRLIAEAYWFC
jgi:hypothetical protein